MRPRGRNRASRSGGVRDERKVPQLSEQVGQCKSNQPVLVDHEDADEPVAHTLEPTCQRPDYNSAANTVNRRLGKQDVRKNTKTDGLLPPTGGSSGSPSGE